MGQNNNHITNESSYLNMPSKKQEKSYFENFINKFLGQVILTKKVFFGFDEQKIVIFITPTLKIASVVASPSKLIEKFPLKKNESMIPETVIEWSEKNGFEISFIAPTPQFKLMLINMFGDVMIDNIVAESAEKEKHLSVLEEVKKSSLPESIKKWVIDNPEKFIRNIEEIKKLLR